MTAGRIRRRPDVLWRRSLDAVVLMPAGADDVLTLAGTGPAVWELLAEWRTYDDLVEHLAAAYGATPEAVSGDLEPLLAELEAHRVIQTAADGGRPDARVEWRAANGSSAGHRHLMDILAILRTLRRHWMLILALTVVGGLLGAASAEVSKQETRSKTFYKAATTLVVDFSQRSGQTQSAFQSLDQVAIFTTTGDVPDAVAETLGSSESGRELAEHIITSTNGSTSTIAITASEPTADGAKELADTFATELVRVLDEKGQAAYGTRVINSRRGSTT